MVRVIRPPPKRATKGGRWGAGPDDGMTLGCASSEFVDEPDAEIGFRGHDGLARWHRRGGDRHHVLHPLFVGAATTLLCAIPA